MKSLWIMTLSLFITLWGSLKVLFGTFTGRISREHIDYLMREWSLRLLSIVKATYTVKNSEPIHFLPHRCYIIMSNHGSLYDIPLIFMALPGSIRMLAKKELFRVPVWGAAMRSAEFISIDRNERAQAIQDLQLAREKMESGIILWMAPEGTRSRTGQLLPLKKGGFTLALQTQAIIVPVGIRGASSVLPPDTWNFNVGQHVEIHIGLPIDTSSFSLENRDKLIEQVEGQLRQLAALDVRS